MGLLLQHQQQPLDYNPPRPCASGRVDPLLYDTKPLNPSPWGGIYPSPTPPSPLGSDCCSWVGVRHPPLWWFFGVYFAFFVVCFGSSLLFLSLGSFKIHFEMVFLLFVQLFGRIWTVFNEFRDKFSWFVSIVFTCVSEKFQTWKHAKSIVNYSVSLRLGKTKKH